MKLRLRNLVATDELLTRHWMLCRSKTDRLRVVVREIHGWTTKSLHLKFPRRNWTGQVSIPFLSSLFRVVSERQSLRSIAPQRFTMIEYLQNGLDYTLRIDWSGQPFGSNRAFPSLTGLIRVAALRKGVMTGLQQD